MITIRNMKNTHKFNTYLNIKCRFVLNNKLIQVMCFVTEFLASGSLLRVYYINKCCSVVYNKHNGSILKKICAILVFVRTISN